MKVEQLGPLEIHIGALDFLIEPSCSTLPRDQRSINDPRFLGGKILMQKTWWEPAEWQTLLLQFQPPSFHTANDGDDDDTGEWKDIRNRAFQSGLRRN